MTQYLRVAWIVLRTHDNVHERTVSKNALEQLFHCSRVQSAQCNVCGLRSSAEVEDA